MESPIEAEFEPKAKKARSPNFSDTENLIIVDLFGQNKSLLTSKFTNVITNKSKVKKWEEIAAECRKANPTAAHTADQVKVRWDNMFTTMKKKVSELRKYKTGGGDPATPLTILEQKIQQLFEDSTLLHGIGGPESGKIKVDETIQSAIAEDGIDTPISVGTPKSSACSTPEPTADLSTFRPQNAILRTSTIKPDVKNVLPKRDPPEDLRQKVLQAELEKIELEKKQIKGETELIPLKKYKMQLEIMQLQKSLGITPLIGLECQSVQRALYPSMQHYEDSSAGSSGDPYSNNFGHGYYST